MDNTTLEQQIAALKLEISNLDRLFEAQLSEMDLTLEELASEPLPDDVYSEKMMTLAQEAATRAGQERAAKYTTTKSVPLPGAGRKGAMRL